MPRVFLPAAARPLAGGLQVVDVPGSTVGQVILELDRQFPGLRDWLCQGDTLRPGLSVTVGDAIGTLGLRQPVPFDAEIHFLPTLGGG